MIKNYITKSILSILMLALFNFSYGQSNHTVTFTGNAGDFNDEEKISGGFNTDYYVTFDEDYIYFGSFRTNSQEFSLYDHFTIYIDHDPQPVINEGEGSTIGVPWDNRTPTLPFNADHRIVIRKGNNPAESESFLHKFDGSSWALIVSNFTEYATSTALEIRIPKSTIENPKGIYFSMFMSYGGDGGGFFGYAAPNYPITFDGDNSSGYFGGIGINAENTIPTNYKNTPILHTLTNTNPTENGKYAHIEINDGYYIAPGNIEIVAGGTANIAAGSALKVDGSITNNGLVSLQSESTSYSSLIVNTVVGSGSFKYNRHVNRIASQGESDLVSAPLTGQTFGAFAAGNPNIVSNPNKLTQKRFGPFNKTTDSYQNYDTAVNADADAILAPGNGYRAAANIVDPSTTGGLLTFTGTVNTGIVSTPIVNTSNSFAKWNLIGNPYPSYIKIKQLLLENESQFDSNFVAIYGYNGANNNEWEVRNLANSGNLLMAPGQGFFVLSNDAGGIIDFNPSLRSAGATNDFIPSRNTVADDNAGIKLNISSGTQSYPTEIYFNGEGTLDHDTGYDTGLIGNPRLSIYSKLVKDIDNRNVALAIQTLPYSSLSNSVVVPIGIEATQGQQLTISSMNTPQADPIPTNVDVYLEDNVAKTSTPLKNENYIFTPNTNLSGMGRFSLRFTINTLNTNDSNFDTVQIYTLNSRGNLIIKGQVSKGSTLVVYDLNGRVLKVSSLDTNQIINTFDISNLSSGIYIVKLRNHTGAKIKKIQVN